MKSKLLNVCLSGLCLAVPFLSAAQSDARKGELTVDAGIGVGMVDYGESKTVFTQRVGAEWVVAPQIINDSFTLAAGFYINNAYGAGVDVTAVGTYDYEYSMKIVSHLTGTNVTKHRRTGYGTATTNIKRDDVNVLPTVSLRYHVTSRLDAYLSVGVGVGIINTLKGDMKNASGFDKKSYNNTDNIGTTRTFSYDDLEHAEWGDLTYTKATAALATYIGARYFVTEHWAVNAQFGLISGNLKKSCGSSYNLFSVGASYKF